MIKLITIEQVELTDAFKYQAREFFSDTLTRVHRARRSSSDTVIKNMNFWLTKGGFEIFLTRLKQLPYAKFDAVKSGGRVYFKATTKDLIVTVSGHRRNRWSGKYDIGPYSIYVPYSDVLSGNIDSFHFIPEKNNKLDGYEQWELDERGTIPHYRHLHHYGLCWCRESKLNNPLTYESRTCWGNFGSMVSAIMNDGDLPELYRTLYLYVSIQNPNSPLVQLENLNHYERIGDYVPEAA